MQKINGKYYGVATEIESISDMEDLDIFNSMDTGVQYRYFEGVWYRQPGYWVDRDDIDEHGSSLPAVTSDDNGDVLTVVEGAWDKAAPGGGGGSVLLIHNDNNVLDKTFKEIQDASRIGAVILLSDSETQTMHSYLYETNINGNEYQVGFDNGTMYFITDSEDGYPALNEGVL